MNVDWLEDESIFYLDGDDFAELVNNEHLWKMKEEQKIGESNEVRKFSIQLHTKSNTTPGKYDDCLLALEEAVAYIKTTDRLETTDKIDKHFDLGKVVRTYEYHKQIQQKYE